MAEEQKDQATAVEEDVKSLLHSLGDDSEQHGAMSDFISRVAQESSVERVNGALLDSYIKELDDAISAQMDEILHNEEFQELESAWRGLQYLVDSTEFSKPVKIEMLDVSKMELFEDLNEAQANEGYEKDSGLWDKVYWGAYDKVGGHPYSCILSDYQFSNSAQDLKLLRHLSILSEMAQLPFLGNAGAEFFGHDSMEDVMNDRNLESNINDDSKYVAWRSFRDDDSSKYIGLALPRFMGRLPYGKDTEPTKLFSYSEGVLKNVKQEDGTVDRQDKSLWVNASFAMAANMIRSFEKWGWSVKIVGVDTGGRVANLPTSFYEEHGQQKTKVPVEASVGQTKDQELCNLGFMPLAHWDRTDYACFFEAPSILRPKEIRNNPEASANYKVGAKLQYTMLVTRIAHYLKYRQLRFVGKNAGPQEIKADLEEWLSHLVSDMPSPPDDVVARRPLRSCKLDVVEMEDRPGYFQVSAEFRPHVAIVGMDIKLRLVAYHSGEQD